MPTSGKNLPTINILKKTSEMLTGPECKEKITDQLETKGKSEIKWKFDSCRL